MQVGVQGGLLSDKDAAVGVVGWVKTSVPLSFEATGLKHFLHKARANVRVRQSVRGCLAQDPFGTKIGRHPSKQPPVHYPVYFTSFLENEKAYHTHFVQAIHPVFCFSGSFRPDLE